MLRVRQWAELPYPITNLLVCKQTGFGPHLVGKMYTKVPSQICSRINSDGEPRATTFPGARKCCGKGAEQVRAADLALPNAMLDKGHSKTNCAPNTDPKGLLS